MNFALALAVAGLALSAASVFVTSPVGADRDVDVVGLENAAQVGLVRCARAQPLDRRFLVAEGFQEGERELGARRTAARQARRWLLRSQRRSLFHHRILEIVEWWTLDLRVSFGFVGSRAISPPARSQAMRMSYAF